MDVFYWIAVAVVIVGASARLTRLLIADDFPPTAWLREKYLDATDGTKWDLLAICAYCLSFWVTLAVVLSGYYSDWHLVWWVVAGSLASSYLSAELVYRDTHRGEDEEGED